ncbi:MAG: hypothetical protein R3E82_12375 [Pseudomonadales bacterium]|nr:hypothetical protein [Pseudomonadales bacterium]
MQYFKRTCRTALAALAISGAMPVLAIGTDAGTTVTNSVTLNYSVNGGAQPQLIDAVSFQVDRALAVDVTATDANWVTVTAGQQYATLSGVPAANYTVTNTSNAASDIVLAIVDQNATQVNTFSPVGGTFFDEVTLTLAIDANANQLYDDGVDTVLVPDGNGIYSLPAVIEDDTIELVLVVEVPGTAAADDYATYTLVAAVATGGAAIAADDSGNASPGQAGTNNPNTAAVETVFRDGSSANSEDLRYNFFAFAVVAGADVASNGQNSDSSGFVVQGVNILVAKFAEVIYDPISGNRYDGAGALNAGVEPKAIPGAVILYVVGVRNNDTTFTAQSLQITDDIPDVGLLLTEPVDEGNTGAAAVNVPASVTFDLDTGIPVVNATFSLTGVTDLDLVHRENCAGFGTDLPYTAGTQNGADANFPQLEVDVAFGDCAAGEDGFIAYFVTVETVN